MPILTITNLGGPLTRRNTGDINSGLAKFNTSWGYDPYSKPGNLTWLEQPTSILTLTPASSVTATIYNMKFRDEGGISYVYAIGGTATAPNLYKIQVANNVTPNLDSPSIIGAFTGDLLYPTGMVFYGSTEKIFFGSNDQIEKINFNGSGRSVLSDGVANFSNNTPRPMATFLGKIYFGDYTNIGEIDSTETITTAAKLSPGLPSGIIVTDLDVTPDGNYLQITASRTIPQIQSGTGSTFPSRSTTEAYKFYWNGIDNGITSFEQYNGVVFFASEVFGNKSYSIGRDSGGGMFMQGREKTSLPEVKEPTSGATYSIGETFGLVLPEFDKSDDTYKTAVFHHGDWDSEVPRGLYRLLRHSPASLRDVKFVVSAIPVTGFGYSPVVSSFAGNLSSVGKIYYSTSEVDGSVLSTMSHRLWRFPITQIGLGSVVAGVYETQNQIFPKKVKLGEVRLYTEPLVADNAFTLAILNSGSSVIAQNTYTVGSNVSAGEDLIRFKPEIAPTQAVGFRITNSGSANWTGLKLEVDYENAGT